MTPTKKDRKGLDAESGVVEAAPAKPAETQESKWASAVTLGICFVGLQASYITWGVVQERVMTQEYPLGKFPSSAFLVFANRFLAVIVAAGLVLYSIRQGTPQGAAPFYSYAPCSISNVLSSWAQYEALNHVTFPLQVLSKSCKIIPVMLMGKFLQGKTYQLVEYVEAVMITFGVFLFTMTEKGGSGKGADESSYVGIILLGMYLTCDSFTSQWQDKVYKAHKVTQFQMMLGINCWSITFTLLSLLQSGEGLASLSFIMNEPAAFADVLTLSICSATGQLFIFYTIKTFGPVIFTIMMTTRQMLSMVLSCFLFGHALGAMSVVGSGVVFAVLFYRSNRKMRSSR